MHNNDFTTQTFRDIALSISTDLSTDPTTAAEWFAIAQSFIPGKFELLVWSLTADFDLTDTESTNLYNALNH